MDHERSEVISGIGRYARNQLELAARLRKEASEVDAMRGKPDANVNEIATRTDRLTWETRGLRGARAIAHLCLRSADPHRATALCPGERR